VICIRDTAGRPPACAIAHGQAALPVDAVTLASLLLVDGGPHLEVSAPRLPCVAVRPAGDLVLAQPIERGTGASDALLA